MKCLKRDTFEDIAADSSAKVSNFGHKQVKFSRISIAMRETEVILVTHSFFIPFIIAENYNCFENVFQIIIAFCMIFY